MQQKIAQANQKPYPPIAVETKAGTLLLLNHCKTMQNIWGRHLRDKTREGLFCLQVIRLFPERLCHLFNKFFTLILHWKLGQNRHHSIAWRPILKHAQANMLRKQQWITTNPFCTGFYGTKSDAYRMSAVIFNFWTLLVPYHIVIPHLRFVVIKGTNRTCRSFKRFVLPFTNHGTNWLCWGDTDLHQWKLLPRYW